LKICPKDRLFKDILFFEKNLSVMPLEITISIPTQKKDEAYTCKDKKTIEEIFKLQN
jgi:hypothetical protein